MGSRRHRARRRPVRRAAARPAAVRAAVEEDPPVEIVETLVPKVLGADVELGNFVEGVALPEGSGRLASRLLLSQVAGVPGFGTFDGWRRAIAPDQRAQDFGRTWLPANGGCVYIDLDHLEVALPETRSAFDHVAHWRAMLDLARGAMARANRELPPDHRVRVFANCTDGLGQAYGSHTNVLVRRATWDRIVRRRPHYLAFLAAYQVSSLVFTGQGKVGSEHGRPPVAYQLSQRADFFETLVSEDTTVRRPIVNSRDEPLAGPGAAARTDEAAAARLHVIFFDSTLAQPATLLRAGVLQIVAAMLEAGRVAADLAFEDPLTALAAISRDPSLEARARTAGGDEVTALEMQRAFCQEAHAFADLVDLEAVVPRAGEILALWADTLDRLEARDWPSLARRLDWVLKRQLLERAMARRGGLDWASPEVKHLDQLYASLDPDEGLFWPCEAAGLVDRVVDDAGIRRAGAEPPADTRAWTRAHLLRVAVAAGADIERVDWDTMTVARRDHADGWPRTTRWPIVLPDPAGSTAADNGPALGPGRSLAEALAWLDPDADGAPAWPGAPFSIRGVQ